jgi:hypothetical protein
LTWMGWMIPKRGQEWPRWMKKKQNGEAKRTGWMKWLEKATGVGGMDDTYKRKLDGLY